MTAQEEYILSLEDESRTLAEVHLKNLAKHVSELTAQRNTLWRRVIALEAEVKNLNSELEGGER